MSVMHAVLRPVVVLVGLSRLYFELIGFRSYAIGVALTLLTSNAIAAEHSAPASKQPIEVKIVSVPPASPGQPAEVRIVSMPAAAPAEVKIVSAPEDDTAGHLVEATWGLLIATMILAITTFVGSWLQSKDTKRRDRVAMERELNRNAHKIAAVAERLDQIARQVPTARMHLSVLAGPGGKIPTEVENALKERSERLGGIRKNALSIVEGEPERMSDQDLTANLRRLDAHEVQMDVMREAITNELSRHESESLTLREQKTTLQAAALHAQLSTKL